MHPLVKITFLIVLLLLINLLKVYWIITICFIMVLLALNFGNGKFRAAISRMRWLWLSILTIYAFATPGEYISILSRVTWATHEGVTSGMLQMAKLLTAIASINFLFSTSHKTDLLAGLNALLTPLKWLGFNVERFSARLFLTLEYVDDIALRSTINLNFLSSLNEPAIFKDAQYLELPQLTLMLKDKLALCAMLVLTVTVMALNVSS
ncbi:MAG: hypothetical protein WBP13_09995 [Methylophilaceae bacterium]